MICHRRLILLSKKQLLMHIEKPRYLKGVARSSAMPEDGGERLIVFTRYPVPGKTKTRMIPKLGDAGAAALQAQMTEHIASRAKEFIKLHSLAVEVRYDGGDQKCMQGWLGPLFSYRHQGDGDIGQRMRRAIAEGFQDGCEAVVIIGSDIPDITCHIMQRAFVGLKNHELVLGPSSDGGYYLIGLRRAAFPKADPHLFEGISWGTGKVLAQSLAIAKKLKLSYFLLDTLQDVDQPEDLAVWDRSQDKTPTAFKTKPISVIIPTLNEATIIKETIAQLQKSQQVEIIVVDGGSQDNTIELARSCHVKVLSTAPSKAGQMNAGAAEAGGDVLIFLHADTRLPDQFDEKVLAAVTRKGVSAGAFTLGIDTDAPGLKFIEQVANWRSRYLRMPYGDQALFVSRPLFNAIGGFPDLPIMEDFELVRRLRRKSKIAILPEAVQTSPRRWLNFGILRTWILNQMIIIAYLIGISPQQLAHWYRREKGKSG
jgi:rSAM/selenodomain-associated transferase 2/rSAM/selenodomain-associated transferase 1